MSENTVFDKIFDSIIDEASHIAAESLGKNLPEPEKIEFSKEHQEAMQRLFKKERNRARLKRISKYSKRAAVFFLVLVIASCVTIYSVEAWRIKIMNFVIEMRQTHSEISFSEGKKGDTYTSDEITLGYIPEGFKIADSRSKMNGIYLSFQNGENSFKLQIQKVVASLSADTENADMKKVKINGKEALYSSNNNTSLLIWHDDAYSYVLSGNIPEKEIFKIAENAKK